jgi:thiol:disulfide interchange protein DsbD
MQRSQVATSILIMLITLVGVPYAAQAKPWWMRGIDSKETDYLPPDVAFRVAARVEGNVIRVRWVIADGYYLYRQKIEVKAESPDLVVAPVQLPDGVIKTDPFLGTSQVYFQQVEAVVPYSRIDAGAHPLQIKVSYQGCTEGLCYPPQTKVVFPVTASGAAPNSVPPYPWERIAILGGVFAFLVAGLILRKGRKLDVPA